ncbi:MAG: hypothetical protein LQ345_000101 [Seirophora villosa]|nr:MAG: hypothetical protein LQ345_000101 [Seirophora villosa]
MAPASVASSLGTFHVSECSTITDSKLGDGHCVGSSFALLDPGSNYPRQPATPIEKKPNSFVQLRPSAEKYNPNARFRPTRSPAVPEADLNTSKLADAFPGFSGIAEDAKPFSPNPFTTKATGHNLKMPSRVKPFQSRVRDENDVSIATETHSSPAKSSSKNSRFGNSHRQKTRLGPQPHVYRPATGLVQNAAALTVAGEPKSMAINPQGSLTSLPNASTQPTLNLPQTTHLTDLFSGVVRHPPPHVAQQTTRPRASRFASATKTHTAVEPKADALHVPADERHLLESIDVLQDRVAELEKIKAQLETTNTNLDQKNFELQIEKREFAARRRSDSGVSISDNASHDSKGQTAVHHRMATENKRLESVCTALEGQKDLLVNDVGVAETAAEKFKQERDQLKVRLSAAETDVNRLRAEKFAIGQKHAAAIAQLTLANSTIDALSKENLAVLEENEKLTAHIALLTQAAAPKDDLTLEQNTSHNFDASVGEDGPIDMDTLSLMNRQQQKAQELVQGQAENTSAPHVDHGLESSHNITYLSYAGDSSICKVRKTLEQERQARQRRHADGGGRAEMNITDDRAEFGLKASKEKSQEYSESSVTKRPTHLSVPRDEMSSGDVIPNISLNQQHRAGRHASLQLPVDSKAHSELAQQDVDKDHTERSDILSYAPVQVSQQPAQQATPPCQPPPISDEELDITILDEEPTIRPTQSPDAALAAVIESLHVELAVQRAARDKYQDICDRHAVSINRRQRNHIHEKLKSLLESINKKSDQIYNLHDVLAGQQVRPITQEQVDDTLQSLGLDLPFEGFGPGSAPATRRQSTASSRSI